MAFNEIESINENILMLITMKMIAIFMWLLRILLYVSIFIYYN